MKTSPPSEALRVCETCPWLTKNHGRKHHAGWYTKANLKRLWNGLRSGDCPGVVCHSTDPARVLYGGVTPVSPGTEKRQCAGALLVIFKHMNEISKSKPWVYKANHPLPMKRSGIAHWVQRYLFGNLPVVEDRSADVSLPWEKQEAACLPKVNQ